MLEKFLEVLTRIAVALEGLGKTMESARVAGEGGGGKAPKAAAAPAPAAPAPVAPAPVAPVPAAPVADDMGLGDLEEVTYTKESILKLAQETAKLKGRPFVKDALKALKADTVGDVQPDDFKKFAVLLKG